MPNPRRYHTLAFEQAKKAGVQLESIGDYLKRFVERLEALKLAEDDPLLIAARKAKRSVADLSPTVLTSARPPKRSRWE